MNPSEIHNFKIYIIKVIFSLTFHSAQNADNHLVIYYLAHVMRPVDSCSKQKFIWRKRERSMSKKDMNFFLFGKRKIWNCLNVMAQCSSNETMKWIHLYHIQKKLWHIYYSTWTSPSFEVYTLRSREACAIWMENFIKIWNSDMDHTYTILINGYIHVQVSRVRYGPYGWNNLKDCAHGCMHDTTIWAHLFRPRIDISTILRNSTFASILFLYY